MGNNVRSKGQERVIDNLEVTKKDLRKNSNVSRLPSGVPRKQSTEILNTDIPHANEHVSIPKNEKEDVFLGYIMKIGTFFICKKQVRFPQTFVHRGIHGQGIRAPEVAGQLQPGVIPFLSQEDVNSIVLENNTAVQVCVRCCFSDRVQQQRKDRSSD